jgi:hypothetical protein
MGMRLSKDAVPPRFGGAADRITYLLAEYKLGVMLAAVAVLLLVATGRLGIPSLPSIVSNALLAVAIGIVPSMAAAKILIVDRYIPDPRVKVAELNLTEDESIVELRPYKVPRDLWDDRKHEQGEPAIEPDGPVDAIVQKYEYDNAIQQITVRGCNREIADPADIAITQNRLSAVYDDMLESKRELMKMKNTQRLRQQEIEENTVNALVAAVEEGTLFEPNGEILEREVWDSVDRETGAVEEKNLHDHDQHDRQTNGSDKQGADSTIIEQ